MAKPSRIGAVTVTYNSGSVIRDFMDSMFKQEAANFALYVIDNASADDTLKLVSSYSDSRVVVIANEKNVGVAEGNNIGIRAALKDDCDLVLLINNDTVFDSKLLSGLRQGIIEHKCDMIVPKILYFDDPEKIWSAGGYFSVLRGSSTHFGAGRRDDGQFDLAKAVDYSPTCCMLIKREVFDRVGLMDPDYFVYFDDTDFCWRARRAGVKLFYLPFVRLRHKVSSLTGGRSSLNTRYYTRNYVYYVLKNYSRWQTLFYCPACYVYILVKYLFFLRSPKSYRVAQKAFWEGISLSALNIERSKRMLETTGV